MKRLILAAALVISLSACGTTTPPLPDVSTVPTAPVPTGSTPISAAAQTALYAAEAAYNVPADAYVRLNRAGRLTPEVKAKTKPILLQAYQALKLARLAAAAGDTAGVMFQAGEAQKLVASARALLPQ